MLNNYPACQSYIYRGCRPEQHISPANSNPCPCFRPCPPYPPYPPCPPPGPGLILRLRKVDACSNNPLAGATFELTRDQVTIASAISPANGEIAFEGLLPGKYQLRETVAPADHKLDTAVYEVEIYPNGTIAVNGDVTHNFVLRNYLLDTSLPPQVNPVNILADTVSGTGSTGCVISVTWPDGSVTGTTVNGGGTWASRKPDLLELQPGDLIRVSQTCPQHLPSEYVYVGVTL